MAWVRKVLLEHYLAEKRDSIKEFRGILRECAMVSAGFSALMEFTGVESSLAVAGLVAIILYYISSRLWQAEALEALVKRAESVKSEE